MRGSECDESLRADFPNLGVIARNSDYSAAAEFKRVKFVSADLPHCPFHPGGRARGWGRDIDKGSG